MKYSKFILNDSINYSMSDGLLLVVLRILVISVFLSACSSQQPVKPEPSQIEVKQVITELPSKQPEQINDQLFIEGTAALKLNNISKAQRLFREFIKIYPKLAGAYVNLALIDFKQEKYKSSLKLTNKAINLNPEQSQAYQLRAQLNIKNGKINEAKMDYMKAIQITPDYAIAQYNLALLYDIYLQDISLAIKHYEVYMSLINKPDEATQEWINHLKGVLKNG